MEREITKRVAIVGAGISGLAAIKSCLEEGLAPTCFEQHDNIGGLWYYTEHYRPNQGARAFDSLTTNASKEMFAYSDFPYPPDASPFLTHNTVHDYLNSYCNHFGLKEFIKLNTRVTMIKRAMDYEVTGRWLLDIGKGGEVKSEMFDKVIICSGIFKKAYMPDIEGLGRFKGTVEHVTTYRNADKFRNKRVLIVGNGNSSGDLAAEISNQAKMVYYSVGPGMWVLPKYQRRGVPYDYLLFSRVSAWSFTRIDRLVYNLTNDRLDVRYSGLCPSTRPTRSRSIVHDDIQIRIMHGKVKVVGRLTRLGERDAGFDDGVNIKDIDSIVFATGYGYDLSFLDEKVLGEKDKLSMYKMLFPTHLPHPSLCLVGCLQVKGAYPPILELQGRVAARVFAGRQKLPSHDVMRKDVDRWNDVILERYGRYKYLMPLFPFRDELADLAGVRPSWFDLIKSGPSFILNYYYGPALPYYERIWGPHSWSGARKAAAFALEHGYYAKQPRKAPTPFKANNFLLYSVSAFIVAVLCFAWLCI